MSTKEILWFEDDNDIVRAIRPRLMQEGYSVRVAVSSEQGKAMIKDKKPDLIIMDIIMEGEHGFHAVEDIKSSADSARIPLVIFSNVTRRWSETTATREDGLLTEADDFVDKAEGTEALLRAIRQQFCASSLKATNSPA